MHIFRPLAIISTWYQRNDRKVELKVSFCRCYFNWKNHLRKPHYPYLQDSNRITSRNIIIGADRETSCILYGSSISYTNNI